MEFFSLHIYSKKTHTKNVVCIKYQKGDVFVVKKTFLSILLTICCIPTIAFAYSDYIIAGGQNIGIELNAKGVMIVGFYKVDNHYIAEVSGLAVGDIITTINDQEVLSIHELVDKINQSNGEIKIGYMHNNIAKYTNLKLIKQDNTYKTGIYVKDSISGIGTLTYIDPNNKVFGALGHEITERSSGRVLDISGGKIFSSKVTNIVPSTNGSPGEKNAQVKADEITGSIQENTIKGIFGSYQDTFDDSKLYKVAKPSEVKKGEAKMLTVLDGTKVEEFTINIIKLNDSGKTKNLLFEITDERLLEKTNGIIQGMSGSPIIQDEKIVGAVTHVVVDNPHRGYGIFITNMLEEGEN